MRFVRIAWIGLLLVGCGGPPPKPESPFVKEGPDTPETCCCKSFPLTSEDGKPVYEMVRRMECSSRQGECVPDVQCGGHREPAAAPSSSPEAGSGSAS
jgi:hypothetical protein